MPNNRLTPQRNLANALNKIIQEWRGIAKFLVSGPVLKIQSGTLFRFFKIQRATTKNLSIALRNYAQSDIGFPYAAFHEGQTSHFSGGQHEFIVPALAAVLGGNSPSIRMLKKAFKLDTTEELLAQILARRGWRRHRRGAGFRLRVPLS